MDYEKSIHKFPWLRRGAQDKHSYHGDFSSTTALQSMLEADSHYQESRDSVDHTTDAPIEQTYEPYVQGAIHNTPATDDEDPNLVS